MHNLFVMLAIVFRSAIFVAVGVALGAASWFMVAHLLKGDQSDCSGRVFDKRVLGACSVIFVLLTLFFGVHFAELGGLGVLVGAGFFQFISSMSNLDDQKKFGNVFRVKANAR